MTLRLCLTVLALSTAACGQETSPPSAPGGQPARQYDRSGDRSADHGPRGDGSGERMHGGGGRPPKILPPGTWWRNPEVIKTLALTDEQRKRIDDAFVQSRVQLVEMHASLEKQQAALDPLLNAQPFDQGKALSAIGKIADTRAELEKTNARMLVGVRALLSQEQWQKLRAGHPGTATIGGAPRGKIGWAGSPPPQ